MDGAIVVGAALGFLIGAISGVASLLVLRNAVATKPTLKTTRSLITLLFGIPVFCFGGHWLTSIFLSSFTPSVLLLAYLTALSATFGLINLYPLLRLVIRVGNLVGVEEGKVNA